MTYPEGQDNTRPPERLNEKHERIDELNMHELLQLHYDLICEKNRIEEEQAAQLHEITTLLEIVRIRLGTEFWQD